MGILRRQRRQPPAISRMGMRRRRQVVTKLAILSSVCLVWFAYKVSTTPGMKTRVKANLAKKLLSFRESNLAFIRNKPWFPQSDDKSDVFERAEPADQYRRIPCGLIETDIASDGRREGSEDDEVLPLLTVAMLIPTDHQNRNRVGSGISTLHERALKRYPQLQQYVHRVSNRFADGTNAVIIPEGKFRLRMGSVEATIERSPELWIVRGDEDGIDLKLGFDFWENLGAEFREDELYYAPPKSGSESIAKQTKSERVMVPYLSMRSSRGNLEL